MSSRRTELKRKRRLVTNKYYVSPSTTKWMMVAEPLQLKRNVWMTRMISFRVFFVAVFIMERRNLLVVIASCSISPSSLLRSGGRQFVAGTRATGRINSEHPKTEQQTCRATPSQDMKGYPTRLARHGITGVKPINPPAFRQTGCESFGFKFQV